MNATSCNELGRPDVVRGRWVQSDARATRLAHAVAHYVQGDSRDAACGHNASRVFWSWTGVPSVPATSEAPFCAALRSLAPPNREGGVLFVGDSVSDQHAVTLAAQLNASYRPPYPGGGWRICGNGRLVFKRNDFLTTALGPHGEECGGLRQPGSPDSDMLSSRCSLTWSHRSFLKSYDVIIVNSGAHTISDDAAFKVEMERAADALAQNARPGALKVWRDLVPGVADCERSKFAPPLASLGDAEAWYARHPFFDGATFRRRNDVAAAIFAARAGAARLHAFSPSIMRIDAHVGERATGGAIDCLHYCIPGPTMLWADLLTNRMIQAAGCATNQRAAGPGKWHALRR